MESTPVKTSTQPPPSITTDMGLKALCDARPKFADLERLGLAGLASFAKDAVKLDKQIRTDTRDFRSNAAVLGKLLAAMMVGYAKAQDAQVLSRGESFNGYHEKVAGGLPNTHAQSCAVTYNSLVVTGKMTEDEYDMCPADWLETAAAAIRYATKSGKTLDCQEIGEVAQTLKKRDVTSAAKQLRSIRNRLKGAPDKEDSGENAGTSITATQLSTAIRSAFAAGMHTQIVAEMLAEVLHIRSREPALTRQFYLGCVSVNDSWDRSGVPTETLEKWLAGEDPRQETRQRTTPVVSTPAAQSATQPSQTPTPPPTPAPTPVSIAMPEECPKPVKAFDERAATDWARKHYGELHPDEIAAIMHQLKAFWAGSGALPDTVEEFDAVMEAAMA